MSTIRFEVSERFSRHPGGRFRKDGPASGEELRAILAPLVRTAQNDGDVLEVILDGSGGYGASFLEEAFGGLVRKEGFSHRDLSQVLKITANTPVFQPYKRLAERYIAEARERAAA